jgi:hypothetical protein
MSDITLTVPVYLDLDPGCAVLVKSSTTKQPAGRLRIVSGDKRLYSLRLHQTPEGSTWQRCGLPSGWTMVLSGKLAPGGETPYFTNSTWTTAGSGTTLAYTATLNFGVDPEFWGSPATTPRVVYFDVEIRDGTNTVRGTWQFEAEIHRENYGSGDETYEADEPFLDRPAADNIYLSFDAAQTLTSGQKTQAQTNLGGSTVGRAVFSLTNPSAVTWLRVNADNTVTARTAAETVTDLGITAGSGDVTSDGTITVPNNGKVLIVNGLKTVGAGVAYATLATPSTLVLRDGSGGILVTAASAGTFGATNEISLIEDGVFEFAALKDEGDGDPIVYAYNTALDVVTFSIRPLTGALVAASGAFTVDSNGNMTATHGKFQGSGEQAGHVILSQGTTPNGTGSTTTLWGISGGFGWRDGTGTAYTFTLGGNIAFTSVSRAFVNSTTERDARQSIGAASLRTSQIPVNDAAWSTANTGTVAVNTYTSGARLIQVASGVTGLGRANFNNANVSSFLPGTRTQVDYSQSFAFSVSGMFSLSATTTSKALITPAASSTLAATDLAAKGIAIRFAGTGSVVQVMIQAHNGTTTTNSTAYTYGTQNDSVADLRLAWIAGTGVYLYLDGTLICSLTTGLPSGLGTSAQTCPGLIVEDASTSTGAVVRLTTITAARG